MGMVFCRGCGKEIHDSASACPHCGAPQGAQTQQVVVSSKSKLVLALVCFFLGAFGIHRFMVGKIGTGILMLVTLGGLGIWSLIDFIVILTGNFSDKQGNKITA